MESATVHTAAQTTGWSVRMLHYLDAAGLVSPPRSPGGYRLYGEREITHLRTLRQLLADHDLRPADLQVALRLRSEPALRDAVDDWLSSTPVGAAAVADDQADSAPPASPGTAELVRGGRAGHVLAALRAGQALPSTCIHQPINRGDRMTTSTTTNSTTGKATLGPDDFKVADMSLADFGRKEIDLAENEMPGLMSLREEFGRRQPLAGARITGTLHMTVQTAVLIETLTSLGADVRWVAATSSPPRTTPPRRPSSAGHRGGAAGCPSSPGRARPLEEYWWCTEQALVLARRRRPQHDPRRRRRRHPARAQGHRVRGGRCRARDPRRADSEEYAVILELLTRSLAEDPDRWTRIGRGIKGVSEETTTGVTGSTRCAQAGKLLFPAINVNDSVTKSKFDNLYGCRHSLIDGINRATDVMIGGKVAVVCGYGDVGKGCAESLRGQGARVI